MMYPDNTAGCLMKKSRTGLKSLVSIRIDVAMVEAADCEGVFRQCAEKLMGMQFCESFLMSVQQEGSHCSLSNRLLI
jgi:soluble P-type ATPase